jgi:YegS/Rv2252/BmrU family lipid kinase
VLDTAIELAPDLLVAGGGDGTISQAARQLAHRDVALGVLPLGTTNNFARTLGVPLGVEGALGVVLDGKVADVDLGLVEGMLFANLVSVGMSTQVARHVPHRLKRLLGRAAYPLTALTRLPGHRPFHARLVIGDTVHELVTHQLNVANGSFHAGRPITSDAGADDRLLVVYAIGGGRRRHLVVEAVRHALTGVRRTMEEPPFVATDELRLETDPPLALDVDGEIRGSTPARIALAPQALRVMVGRDFPDT